MSGETRTCGNCEAWKHPRTDFGDVVQAEYDEGWQQTPESIAREAAYGHCTAIEMGPVGKDVALPLAVVLDGSEYKADLYTLPDFGCALWRPAVPVEGIIT